MNDSHKTPSLWQLVWAYFLIGLTAYSMAMLEQIKALVIKRGWLSQEEVDEGLAMVQLYPGPIIFNLVTYTSYRIKGFVAAFLSTFVFLLPSFFLMLALSYLYFRYGKLAWVHPLFIAIEAMVVGIVLHISLDFGKRYVNGGKAAVIAALAFLLLLYKINAFYIVIFSFILGIALFWHEKIEKKAVSKIPGKWRYRLIGIALSGAIFIGLLAVGLFVHDTDAKLLLAMFKVGAVAFGNGMTILPLLQQVAVASHHWLSLKEFANAVAFGQITPGPFLITATFIGYKVSGIIGSIAATIGIFYPSFFYTIFMSEIYEKIKNIAIIQKALKGILSAFTGMLFFVTLSLAKVSLIGNIEFVYAIGAFIGARYFKLNILWTFLIGIAAQLMLFFGKGFL